MRGLAPRKLRASSMSRASRLCAQCDGSSHSLPPGARDFITSAATKATTVGIPVPKPHRPSSPRRRRRPAARKRLLRSCEQCELRRVIGMLALEPDRFVAVSAVTGKSDAYARDHADGRSPQDALIAANSYGWRI